MTRKETDGRMTHISFRLPKSLKKLVETFINQGTYINESEFFREAMREKIRTDAPELYSQLFKEEKAEV